MSFKPTSPFRASRAAKRVRTTPPEPQPVVHDRRPARPVPAPALTAVPTTTPALRPLPASGGDGLVELLWHDRRVESFGLAHRIAIPLAGRPFSGDPSGLASVLSDWWGAPGRLSNGTTVTFVGAEIVHAPLAPSELVLTVTTAHPVGEAQVANLRTIRDLRRALRDLRRGVVAPPSGALALV